MISILLTGFLWAQGQSELTVEVVINADHGWPTRILVHGYSELEEAWLGISLYPYGVLDPITGGRHSSVTLKKGEFSQTIKVDQPLLGGSFEFAIWGKKVDKVDCTLDYCYWCKVNGYHFEDLIVYKSGLLNNMVGY
jgi:hypothetical protein